MSFKAILRVCDENIFNICNDLCAEGALDHERMGIVTQSLDARNEALQRRDDFIKELVDKLIAEEYEAYKQDDLGYHLESIRKYQRIIERIKSD